MSVRRAAWLALVLLSGCATPAGFPTLPEWLTTPAAEPEAQPPPAVAATAALPAPEGLAATSGELRAIPLHWDPVLLGDVGGYVVERADQREGPYRAIASLDGRSRTAWVDRGPGLMAAAAPGGRAPLNDGQTFFYRVRPRTASGELGVEASVAVAGTTAPAPDAPEELRAYSHQPRNVPLSWQASDDASVAGYIVERSPTSRGPFEELAEIDDRFETLFVDENLGDLRVFYYRVRSVNRAGGRGEPSKPARAVTKPEPLPPMGLRVAAQNLGANELTWDPNVETDLAGYELLRSREGSDQVQPLAQLDAAVTRAVDAGVSAGERVHYRLRALDRDGLESDAGPPLEVVSQDYELEVAAKPEGNVLSWRDRSAEGWVRAHLFLVGPLGPTELGTAAGTRFVHTGVTPGKRYRYRAVFARADGRRAPESKIVSVEVPAR